VGTGTDASWYDPFGLGDKASGAITDGIEAGLTSAFKAVFGPIVQWSFWLGETALGLAGIVFGALLLVKETPPFKKAESVGKAIVSKGAVKPEAETPQPEVQPVKQVAIPRSLAQETVDKQS
jgi:hypothetical protein